VALAPLATAADLQTRGVDVTDTDRVDAALAAASEAVRDAAGCPISSVEATISLPAPNPCDKWLELPGPVTAVDSVEVAGEPVTEYVQQGSLLWARSGWRNSWEPVNVEVTLTFGYAEVPADIVALVCDLATASLLQSEPTAAGTSSIAIDDYRETFTTGDDAVSSVFELPPRTRAWLRQRFGSSAVVTDVRQ
jgi:hypothetical protein